MSGLYLPLVLTFGAMSVLLTVVVLARMDKFDGEFLHYGLKFFELVRYTLWLFVEIAKSNWAVTKIILSGKEPERARLVRTPHTQQSDIAKVIFANSITLTPGTITVEVEPETMMVHALSLSDEDMEGLADMDRRVTAVEAGSGS